MRPPPSKPTDRTSARSSAVREQAEVADRYRQLVELSPEGIVLLVKGRIAFINPEGIRLLGAATPEQVLGKDALDFVHPDSRDEVAGSLGRLIREGDRVPLRERKWLRVDGSPLEVETAGSLVAVGGEPAVQVVFRDITIRKRLQEQLVAAEARYRGIVDVLAEGIVVRDGEGRLLVVNAAAERILGIPRDRVDDILKSGTAWRLIREDGAKFEADRLPLFETLRSGQPSTDVVVGVERPDGTSFWARVNTMPLVGVDGAITGIVSSFRDITQLKEAQSQLTEREQELQAIFDGEPECVKLLGPAGELLEMNRAGLAMLEAGSLEQLRGRSLLDLVDQAYCEPFRSLTRRVFEGGSGVLAFEVTGLRGGRRWLETHAVPLRNSDGSVRALLGITRDITQQKNQQEALNESEETFRALVEHTDDIIARLDPEGRCQYINPAVTTHLGIAAADVIGKVHWEIGSLLGGARRWEQAVRAVFETARPGDQEVELQTVMGPRVFRWRLTPEHDGTGRPKTVLSTLHDVTVARQAQDALARTLADLRRLTMRLERVREEERAVISREIHDQLGQTLTGLKLDASWLERKIRVGIVDGERDAELARLATMRDTIDETVRSVRRIATDLRPPLLDDLGLGAAVQWQAEQFAQRTGMSARVTVEEGPAASPDSKLALFRILQECLTNIARHARAIHVVVDLKTAGGNLVLTVADDGIGFDSSLGSEGSLGLLGMRERAEQLGGWLSVNSAIDQGTTIKVSIPA